ncbi:restriction endonuclease subunit S [Pusillimonas caeni]|uniref:restriction endonuclease subunit S n=1 Tax=Pusillimonas caeni TaxID=1348472 RepID=UPI000E59D1AB|nr:restriction endonuclease subunit S [Pusillimonas caeni]TFL15233.1 restriction endonuclease subunit S [Pusillimonas caeni]
MNKHFTEMLEKHFDSAFAAPDGIKKLRELILTLAMQGKLVPQNPNDQPASKLLKEIEVEKQRLVKEGKIKKPKPLPPVMEKEKLYSLPQGWEWTRIGAIGNIFNGNSINAGEKESKYVGVEGLPYIATKDVGYGFEALDYNNGIYIPLDEEKFRVAHEGAVLICAEGGSAGKKCGLTDRDICFGNKLFANELYGRIPSRFILHVYLSPIFRASFIAAMTGIIGGVSIAKFVEIPIPLPPLEEQHRVVSKINELMARCDELEKLRTAQQGARLTVHAAAVKQLLNIAEPDQYQRVQAFLAEHFGELYSVKENVTDLRKAVLQLAVIGKLTKCSKDDSAVSELLKKIKSERLHLKVRGTTLKRIEPNRLGYFIPEHWSILPLGEILIFGPTNGYSPRAVDYETNVKSLTLSATTSGTFRDECFKFIAEEIPVDSELWLQEGDILVQRGNTLQYVGVPAIYRGQRNTYIYPDLMMKLRISTELNKDYVYFVMSATPSRDFLRDRASGTSGTMPKINQKTLSSLPIPIPPLEEQHRIVKKINELMALCDSLEQQIDATTDKQTELLSNLIRAQSQGNAAEGPQRASHTRAQVIDLAAYRANIGCYAFSKLANAQYFGRTAAAKVMYLAQAHVGLELNLKPERKAAGPLDPWIYDFERQGQDKRWFEVNEKTLANGRKKTEYRCLSALSEPAAKAEALMSPGQKTKFDRLIYALADKKTEEVEIITTLFAVWNDFLIDGVQPTDAQIISDVRENWHESKARFTPAELGRWLDWLGRENIIPQGLLPRTMQQSRLDID